MKKNNYSTIEKDLIHKKYHKNRMIIFLILIIISTTMTIAYSTNLSTILYLFGTVNLEVQEGTLEITNIEVVENSATNATDNGYTISVKEGSNQEKYTLVTDFDIDYYRESGSSTTSIAYNVTIKNNSFKTMVLNEVIDNTEFTSGESTLIYTMQGANIGTTVLKYGEETTIKLIFNLGSTERNTHYIVKETIELEFLASTSSLSLFAALNNQTALFDDINSLKDIQITVINNSEYNIEYNFSLNSENFEIVDEEGKKLSNFTISANSTDNVNIYLKVSKQNVLFSQSSNIDIKLNTYSPIILTYDVGNIQVTTPQTGLQKILGTETIYDDSTIDFTKNSSTNGVYKNSTNGEITYFYRGNVTNNYVSFAGYTWRIIKIDKYGTRVILDSVIDQTSSWASSNKVDVTDDTTDEEKLELAKSLLSYENSNVKPILDAWYNEKLSDYSDIIQTSMFCEDFTHQKLTSSGSRYQTYYFGSYIRNGPDSDDYTPEFVCEGTNATKKYYKIGLISGDELAFAGALFNSLYTDLYLYNPNITSYWWSYSPSYYDTVLNTVGILIFNGSTGRFHDWQNGSTIANANAIRPVITLDTERLTGGTGVVGDEYKFE